MKVNCLINLLLSLNSVLLPSCPRVRGVGRVGGVAVAQKTWVPTSHMGVCWFGIAGDAELHGLSTSILGTLSYSINFSWNFISQQACLCHPPALLQSAPFACFLCTLRSVQLPVRPLPSCSSQLTFTELHLGLVFPKFIFTFLKLCVTDHPATISKFQELTYFAAKCLKKGKVMCRYTNSIRLTYK